MAGEKFLVKMYRLTNRIIIPWNIRKQNSIYPGDYVVVTITAVDGKEVPEERWLPNPAVLHEKGYIQILRVTRDCYGLEGGEELEARLDKVVRRV